MKKDRLLLSKQRYVEVVWLDANSSEAWQQVDAVAQTETCVTRGWLIHEDDTSIIVAGTVGLVRGLNPSVIEDVCGTLAIPKGMIQSMKDWPVRRAKKVKAVLDPDPSSPRS